MKSEDHMDTRLTPEEYEAFSQTEEGEKFVTGGYIVKRIGCCREVEGEKK